MSISVVYPPGRVTTPDDHSAIVLTVAAFTATIAVLCWLIRVYIRWGHLENYKWDDYMCSIGTLVGVIQTIVACSAVAKGFGRRTNIIEPEHIPDTEMLLYASDLLYIITNVLAKCSTTLLIVRISRMRQQLLTCYVALLLIVAWGFGSFLAEALRCDLSRPWLYYGHQCSGLFVRWQVITAFDVIIETVLFALAAWLVWDLQMPLMSKGAVVSSFSLRLPVIAAAILRLHYIGTISRDQPFITGVPAFALTQVEMHYGLMAATIPCLKSFVGRFNTGWGQMPVQSTIDYAMQSRDKTASSVTAGQTFDADSAAPTGMRANVANLTSGSGRARAGSLNSHSSQQNIIHKTVEWGVGHQPDETSNPGSDQNYWQTSWNGH